MLLTCPNCRSGLQVPDGTTAMVRCPACKTVFSPAAGYAPPEPEPEEEEREERPARRRRKPARRDDEDERPRKRKPATEGVEIDEEAEEEREKDKNRDFDPHDPNEKRPKRKRRDPDELTAAERAEIERAFARATIGCRLIWISFVLFILSMILVLGLWVQAAFTEPSYAFILGAGAFGTLNWLLAAAGIGMCLSGPRVPGFLIYGIGAAVACGIHLLLLGVLVGQGTEYSAGKVVDPEGPGQKLGLVPTRMDAFTFYLTFLLYRDQDLIPKAQMNLSMIVGVAEVIRTMFILMLLSCLAKAAGDDELSAKCTRAAGVATFGAGVLAVLMLIFVAIMVETNATSGDIAKILFTTLQMGIYAMLSGTMFPGMMAAQEVTDCCDEPFQSQIPRL